MPAESPYASDPAWRLEAFDLRAGLAFATWRPDRSVARMPRDWPCLFFTAPDFSPETVDNVAAALGATRGSFDGGPLPGGDEHEAAFDRPEHVAEFLRRAYLASAAGDGADGDEPPPTPRPEGPPTATVEPSSDAPDADGAALAIHAAVNRFQELTTNLEGGETFAGPWSGIAEADATGACLRGAQLLLEALVQRLPVTHAAAGAPWLADLRGLGAGVAALGLWPLLRTTPRTIATMQALRRRAADLWPPLARLGTREFAYLLFATDAAPDDLQAIEHLAARPLGWAGDAPAAAFDALEGLERLPVPPAMRSALPADLGERASAMHLVSLFVASPGLTLKPLAPATAGAVIDVVCLAAALLAAPSTRPARPREAWPIEWGAEPTPMQKHAAAQAAQAGMAWLVEHLPARGFDPALEAAIAAASRIRYR